MEWKQVPYFTLIQLVVSVYRVGYTCRYTAGFTITNEQ